MRSMTGYSKQKFESEEFSLTIELKSVNNKNLNLKFKMPSTLNFLENKLRTEISKKISRGSVDVRVEFQIIKNDVNQFEVDYETGDQYMELLNETEKRYSESFSNKLDILIKNLNLIKRNEVEIDEQKSEEIIIQNLHLALDSIIEMKSGEGERLRDYFSSQIEIIKVIVEKVKELKEQVVENYKEKLLKRLAKIDDIEINEEQILREILIFTDKADISEELSRLESHLHQLEIEIKSKGNQVGKKIDFILQEIFRELNTTGVKSNSYDISKLIVEAKNEIEKIREQALNIE